MGCPNGDVKNPELEYISVYELIRLPGVQLDITFSPAPLEKIKNQFIRRRIWMAKKRSQDKPLMMPLDQGLEIPNSIPMGATMSRCALALLTD